jgi:hypothetical protein
VDTELLAQPIIKSCTILSKHFESLNKFRSSIFETARVLHPFYGQILAWAFFFQMLLSFVLYSEEQNRFVNRVGLHKMSEWLYCICWIFVYERDYSITVFNWIILWKFEIYSCVNFTLYVIIFLTLVLILRQMDIFKEFVGICLFLLLPTGISILLWLLFAVNKCNIAFLSTEVVRTAFTVQVSLHDSSACNFSRQENWDALLGYWNHANRESVSLKFCVVNERLG